MDVLSALTTGTSGHRRDVAVASGDLVARTLVLVPTALLLAMGLDLGGARAPLSQAVIGAAEAVAQPVADELLERLPWPGPRTEERRRCVFGPHAAGGACAVRAAGQAPT